MCSSLRKKSRSEADVSDATEGGGSLSQTPTSTTNYQSFQRHEFRQSSSLQMKKSKTSSISEMESAFGGFGFYARDESAKTPAAKIEDQVDLFGFGNNSSGDEDAKGKEDDDDLGYFPLKPRIDQPCGRRTTNLSDLAVTGQSSIESGSLFDSPDPLKPQQRKRKITWHGDNDPTFPGTPTSSRGGKLMTGGNAATGSNSITSAVSSNHQPAIA